MKIGEMRALTRKCKMCQKRRVIAFRAFGMDLWGGGDICKPCGHIYAVKKGCKFCHCGQELWCKENKLALYCNRCQNKCFKCVQSHKIGERCEARGVFEDTLQEQRIGAYRKVLEELKNPYKNHPQQAHSKKLTPVELVKLLIEDEYWQ